MCGRPDLSFEAGMLFMIPVGVSRRGHAKGTQRIGKTGEQEDRRERMQPM